MVDTVRAVHPDVLVLSAAQRHVGLLASGATGPAAAEEWRAGVLASLIEMAPHAGEIVVLGNPPDAGDPRQCASRLTGPEACLVEPDEEFDIKQSAERRAARAALLMGLPVTSVDVRGLFCSSAGCPAFIADTPVRVDRTHLTQRAGVFVGGALRSLLPASP